ncbi:Microsomal glutathione S-transferase 3 [Smittium culicis]|uniref:Microsomal glutathione S-transferase 3 n=1 Tax=Smittium culicis TaxID=133412 RepID=A0A1R1XRT0_9FUNG|nr:Microsomal glutathione S-transferase 3 [Smittium culicis]
MGFQCFVAGTKVADARKKYNVDYPDMGSGRFAAKLSDKDWTEFNNIMRVHQNYIEALPFAMAVVLVSGLFHPTQSALTALAYIVGRYVYANGYSSGGPEARLTGAKISMSALFINFLSSLIGIFNALRSK